MDNLKVNSLVKLQTLCLLNKGPKHGYDIIKELTNSMNRKISASHVYPFLKELEENQFINCQKIEERDKKRYYLTDKGDEFIQIVLSKMTHVMDAFLSNKITSCHGCESKIYDGEHVEIINEMKKTFCCKHCSDAYKQNIILRQSAWQTEDQVRTASRF